MRNPLRYFSTLLALSFACSAGATTLVTNVTYGGSSGVNNAWWTKSGPEGNYIGATLGGQLTGSGQYNLNLTTDNPADPTFTLSTALINSSGFTWNNFVVDVSMSSTFLLSGVANTVPGDWTATVFQPGAPVLGIYTGQIIFNAGTPVIVGSHFNFDYSVTFSGGPSFSFTETLTPNVPEPGILGLFGLGFLLVARRNRIQR